MFEVLDIFVPGQEYWDAVKQEFIPTKPTTLHLKHSLISLTRWEQKYKRLFLSDGPKTTDETIYYIKCMTMNREPIDELVYHSLTVDDLNKVVEYIKDPMTATIVPKQPKKDDEKPEKLSSELIYYYMSALSIPFEVCEKWHLNNLLTLIELASVKNAPEDKKNKRSSAEIMKDYAALNKANRAKYHTKG